MRPIHAMSGLLFEVDSRDLLCYTEEKHDWEHRTNNMYLYETHMHTYPTSWCAECSPVQQVLAYKKRGYAGIIITDHFSRDATVRLGGIAKQMEALTSGYREARREGLRVGLDVFLGWEYGIAGSDLLTYGLTMEFLLKHPELNVLNLEQYSTLVRENGAYLAQAHPFRQSHWIANPYPLDPGCLDGIEAFNASIPDDVNQKAFAFAKRHGLAVQAGSDSHRLDLPFVSGVALSEKAERIEDIIEAIRTQRAGLILPKDWDDRSTEK